MPDRSAATLHRLVETWVPYPDKTGAHDAIDELLAEKDAAATSFESAHPEYRGMVTVWDAEGRYVGCMGVELWRHLLTVEAT